MFCFLLGHRWKLKKTVQTLCFVCSRCGEHGSWAHHYPGARR